MTSTLTPGARIWRGGVPTLLPGTGFQGGGEVGDAGSDPYVAPPSEDYTDVRMVDTAWTSLFDVHKDDLRLGAETARREGYSGIPDMKPYEMNRYWESPEGLRNAGAEMYSRILHSEDPSKYTLSRAMMLDDDDLAKIRVGEPYSLPLSSFGSEDFATRYLYPDESLMFESAEREGKNIPVMLKLLKGAKTTSVAEEGLSGGIGPPLESVTLGNFDVVSIKDVDRGGGHKYKEITLRQKDIGPAPIETPSAPTELSLPDTAFDPWKEDVPVESGYLYHATNDLNATDILNDGELGVHDPSYGTDQDVWPDGGEEPRSYWTGSTDTARSFYPEGEPILLRAKRSAVKFKRESTGDIYSREPVPASELEIYTGNGKWVPLGNAGKFPYPLDPESVAPKGIDFLDHDRMVANIMASYNRTVGENEWMRAAGMQWYTAAREWIQKILEITGSDMDLDRAAGITAQFSEQAEWPVNMQRFMDYITGHKVGATGANLRRVQAIAEATDPLSAVRGPKVNDFVRSILGGFKDSVAVDRWMARTALGTSDKALADKLKARAGGYEAIHDAYVDAARQVGIDSSELQGVIWVESGPTESDSTIRAFKELGEFRFPVTREEITRLAYEAIGEKGGVTIDLSTFQPSAGYAYSPKKTTELPFDPGTITPEDLDAYIDKYYKDLRKPGNYLGAWVDKDTGKVYLDVSRVGDATADFIATAQKAKQLAVYDLSAPEELAQLNIGKIDHGKYSSLGSPSDLHAEHLRQIQAANESRSAGSTSGVSGSAEEPAGRRVVPPKAKALKEKALREGRGRTRAAGPGSARKPPTALETTTDVLGKAGRVLGPIATVAGDVYTAYGLVGQAAEQGQEEELAQGHVIAQGPKVLGIPTGKAFADPTFKSGQSTAGRSKADIQYWLKHGKWPETSTGPESLIGTAGRQDGGLAPGARIWKQGKPVDQTLTSSSQQGLQMSFRVQHADGTVSRHSLDQSSPMVFAGPQIDMRPGDQFFIDGNYG